MPGLGPYSMSKHAVEAMSDVVHAFTAGRPRTRYCKGEGSGARKVLRHLPDRWVDAITARTFRWG